MAASPTPAVEKTLVWRTDNIPPFPSIALRALNLMAGTDTSLIELCELIRPDIAFSAEILRLANSPLVAFSKTVTSVLQASTLLGFRRLRSMVITIGLRSYVANSFSPVIESCWRHSLACAILSESAAKHSGQDKDFAYTAGILHDIGMVVLAVSLPDLYTEVVARGAEDEEDVRHGERLMCGIDHCEAGATIVQEWKLPAAFAKVIGSHHDLSGRLGGIDAIVAYSSLLADVLGFGIVSYRNLPEYSHVLAQFPEEARGCFPDDGKELASEVRSQIKLIESA